MKQTQNFIYDKRISHRFVAKNKISKEELNNHLASLVDSGDQCEDISNQIFGDIANLNKANKTNFKSNK
jgi:hypothetical protein